MRERERELIIKKKKPLWKQKGVTIWKNLLLLVCLVSIHFKTYFGTDAINTLLCSSVGMDSGHKSFNNAKLFMENFGHRSKAVGGARSIANKKCKEKT